MGLKQRYKQRAQAKGRRRKRRDDKAALVMETQRVFVIMPKGEMKRMMNEDKRPFKVTEVKQ